MAFTCPDCGATDEEKKSCCGTGVGESENNKDNKENDEEENLEEEFEKE